MHRVVLYIAQMPEKRIIFTISRILDAFLEQKSEETGIDKSNLIRMRLWEWLQEDRRLRLQERKHDKD